MSTVKLVAVTGITGKQGGAVARKLLELGHRVRGLTRNASSPSAIKLAQSGIEMVSADMEDVDSLKAAFAGADSVFVVTTPGVFNAKIEVKQGRNAADAAKATGITHFVFSSVGNSENAPDVPHFASKRQVEVYVRDKLKLPYTIVRPSFFMENYALNGQMAPSNGVLKGFIPANYKLQMVAVEDIGKVAAIALSNREKYLNQIIELSGDELTGDEMASVLTNMAVIRHIYHDMGAMTNFFMRVGYNANIPKLREEFPDLQTWETWLSKNGFSKSD
ncbi:hypothetical protein G6F46_003147 [Rhizopus delemar]|uniref:NmrA-like domain-containing protein n=3 Tax=Rhizopus TaxID=4842 RepID=I1BKK5_RHIO9|nr:hypothetical protein RO3G_01439 [Rhizopus delemar RA 99-880]KAG1446291.1 hypothetical protein G6F55_011608 [Rhizopus delemar]KAG1549673.1 hypothetical protein G6F51_002911 [Rhizopus arrhizus]KAG1502148.1 hypothetical protein G6F54_002549 [Rhizopus delemar]KAG1506593.1 hypothetical protein G6F52_011851 [Rhizopus delemar]|eukprot:EIE76735.1 hypothetical protein RO3G_01439 [Rhizopus delemar RA 99-880]